MTERKGTNSAENVVTTLQNAEEVTTTGDPLTETSITKLEKEEETTTKIETGDIMAVPRQWAEEAGTGAHRYPRDTEETDG